MTKNSQKQVGSVPVTIVIIAVVALLGVLGYVAWNNFFAPKSKDVSVNETMNVVDDKEVEYETVEINGRNFRYPLNKNNEDLIIIPDEATPALQVSYESIRDYYADKGISDDCKSYVAGLVNVNTEKEIIDYSYLTRFYGKETLEDALADGTVVRVGENDLYLAGPFKQHETCSDIYESNDQDLKDILSKVSGVRLAWLKSLELMD